MTNSDKRKHKHASNPPMYRRFLNLWSLQLVTLELILLRSIHLMMHPAQDTKDLQPARRSFFFRRLRYTNADKLSKYFTLIV